MDSKFRDLHITGKHPSSEDGAMKANTLMLPHRRGEEQRVSQCSGHVYPLELLLWQQQNAFNRDHFRVIVSFIAIILIYRIVYRSKTVFDIS